MQTTVARRRPERTSTLCCVLNACGQGLALIFCNHQRASANAQSCNVVWRFACDKLPRIALPPQFVCDAVGVRAKRPWLRNLAILALRLDVVHRERAQPDAESHAPCDADVGTAHPCATSAQVERGCLAPAPHPLEPCNDAHACARRLARKFLTPAPAHSLYTNSTRMHSASDAHITKAQEETNTTYRNTMYSNNTNICSSTCSTSATPSPSAPPPPSSPLSRPKRGRRRKRPDLSNEQRRELRATQNREATRRSRERVRRRSALLRLELEQAHQHEASLRAQRDRLLAVVSVATFPKPKLHQGAMSLSVILNPPDNATAIISSPAD